MRKMSNLSREKAARLVMSSMERQISEKAGKWGKNIFWEDIEVIKLFN